MATNIETETSFLPLIFEILKSSEKDSHDMNQKVTDLKLQLQKARETLEKMPEIQYSKGEQLHQIDILRQQLVSKTELLKKYKDISNFDSLLDIQT
ncbi:hypothetical protein ScPMuIL_004967 [Solemya velum]